MKKLLLSLGILALLLCAWALAEDFTEGDFTYTVADGTACITAYTGDAEDLTVPAALGGYPVTAIGKEAFDAHDMLSVTLPDGIITIGESAFNNCSAMRSINLPASLTDIGAQAFSNCTKLAGITFPEGLISIGDRAFAYCVNLTEIDLPASITSIGANPFANCWALTAIRIPADHPVYESVDGVLFDRTEKKLMAFPCALEISYAIPEGTRIIGASAFDGSMHVTDITISDSVTTIECSAFGGCESLSSITIP